MCISRIKILTGSFCAIVGLTLFLAAAAHSAGAQEWHPIGPEKDSKDWIQLVSGEWLRGNMDLFRDLEMSFDSDKLDDLVLDWEDISAFRMSREMTFVFSGQRIYTGSASMKDRMIRINTGSGPKDFPRGELLTIIEGSPRERNFWSANINIGYTQRVGNTNQIDLSTSLSVKREATRSRTRIDHHSDFSEVSGGETVNNQKNNLGLDLFVSRRFYITAVSYEYYADKFQNIDYRNTAGAGVGYFIFRKSKIDWSIGVGGGYQVTQFLSVEEGEDMTQKSGSVAPSMSLDWDITKDIEWEFEYSSKLGVPDIKTSTHHSSSNISIDFFKDIFELTFSIVWNRVDNPQPYADGTVPAKDDVKMIFGFGIDL